MKLKLSHDTTCSFYEFGCHSVNIEKVKTLKLIAVMNKFN